MNDYDWDKWLRRVPTWLSTIVGLLALITSYFVLFRQEFYLAFTVFGLVGLITFFFVGFYLLFARTPPLLEGGSGVYRFPNSYRLMGFVLVGLSALTFIFLFILDKPKQFIEYAFLGTPTMASPITLLPTDTPQPYQPPVLEISPISSPSITRPLTDTPQPPISSGRKITPTFVDVTPDYWAYQDIEELYNLGYTEGCAQDPREFCPDDPLTRAQAAVMLIRILYGPNYQVTKPDKQIFQDVPTIEWFAGWVYTVYTEGYMSPCNSDNGLSFCPNKELTRGEAAVIFAKVFFGPSFTPLTNDIEFVDLPHKDYSTNLIEAAYIKGFVEPCQVTGGEAPDIYFCPDQVLKRARAARWIVNMRNLPGQLQLASTAVCNEFQSVFPGTPCP